MKKFSLLIVLFTLLLGFTSCNSCGNKQAKDVVLGDTTEVVAGDSVVAIDVDHAIAMDRQAMYLKFGGDYRWFETCIRLPEFLDSENVTSDPEMVVNVFQSIVEKGNGADVCVWKFQHFPDGTVAVDSVNGFWIEDFPLNEEVIKFNYTSAFQRVFEVNLPKPHSKNVILRNPVGPIGVNAQWVFGNISEQIWIDAVTGEAKSSNPAFPEEKGFKMPLGEWP